MTADTPETTSPPADKRQNFRYALLIKKVRLEDDRRVFFGYCTNLSCSGLFISSINPTPVGSKFTIELTLPPPINRTFTCQCKTIWQRRYSAKATLAPGMGLNFIDLSDELKEQINDWIHAQEEEETNTDKIRPA